MEAININSIQYILVNSQLKTEQKFDTSRLYYSLYTDTNTGNIDITFNRLGIEMHKQKVINNELYVWHVQ